MNREKKMDNKGFSLVELIVVIAIMAILVGALAPSLLRYIEKARKSSDIQAAGAVYTAVMTAVGEPGVTPDNGSVSFTSGSGTLGNASGSAWEKELNANLPSPIKLQSKEYNVSSPSITYTVNATTGEVTVVMTGGTMKTTINSGGATETTK